MKNIPGASSSQSKFPPGGDRNAADIPDGPPQSARNRGLSIDLNLPPIEAMPARTRSQSPAHSRPPPTRYSASPTKLPSPDGLGCGFDQLEFLRFISYRNPQQIFRLRRHTFVEDRKLRIVAGSPHQYALIPNREHIVLSTNDGIAFAILESFENFGGMYKRFRSDMRRVKVNMNMYNVTVMEKDEIVWTPVGTRNKIRSFYKVVNLNHTPSRN